MAHHQAVLMGQQSILRPREGAVWQGKQKVPFQLKFNSEKNPLFVLPHSMQIGGCEKLLGNHY